MSTDIYLVLDESGSMNGREQEVVTAINEYINDRRGDPDSYISIVCFDTSRFDWVYRWQHCATARHITVEDYKPMGGTPLNDSVAKTIRLAQQNPNTDKLIVVYTDGWENASREFPGIGNTDLKAMIENLNKKVWAVLYLGEDKNSQKHGNMMGAAAGNSAVVETSAMAASFMSQGTRSYYSNKALDKDQINLLVQQEGSSAAPTPPTSKSTTISHGKNRSDSAIR